jgi:hypothetical protein
MVNGLPPTRYHHVIHTTRPGPGGSGYSYGILSERLRVRDYDPVHAPNPASLATTWDARLPFMAQDRIAKGPTVRPTLRNENQMDQ